jgi:uncharacterized membrane protein YeaQ/YmgE (transglycosylase-associated protein family)
MIYPILVGAIAGYLAGHIMRGEGYGAVGNILIGIFGGIVGGIALWLVGFHSSGIVADVISGTGGAVALVYFCSNKRLGGRSKG